MPRRSNKTSAQLGAAAASAADWERLVSAAAGRDDTFHVKVVCLEADPAASSELELFCFTTSGQPLASGNFRCEEAMSALFAPFVATAEFHGVVEIVFQEASEGEGIVLGIKNTTPQMISRTNLATLRAQTS